MLWIDLILMTTAVSFIIDEHVVCVIGGGKQEPQKIGLLVVVALLE